MPFPLIKYKTNNSGSLFTLVELVDAIHAPAMVVPSNINHNAYIETNMQVRAKLRFYNIPYQFLIRDNWESSDILNQKSRVEADVGNTFFIFERANKMGQENMLNKIKDYAFPEEQEEQQVDEDSEDYSEDDEDEDE
jgi:hypothetical protein